MILDPTIIQLKVDNAQLREHIGRADTVVYLGDYANYRRIVTARRVGQGGLDLAMALTIGVCIDSLQGCV